MWFGVAALGVWRLTHLLALEDGPARLIARLRAAAGGGFWAALLGCFNCLTLWVAVPFALLLDAGVAERAVAWLGLSGAACLLQRAVGRESEAPMYYEGDEQEAHDVVLRRTEPGNDPPDGQ